MTNLDGLCASCTSDSYLSAKIRKIGKRSTCVGCGRRRKCIPVSTLATDIEEILEKHFSRCDSVDHGDDLNGIVQEIASVEPDTADRIIKDLLPSEMERYRVIKDGGDLFIEDGATYEERSAYTGDFDYTWQSFCFNVKHSARFFSATAESRLSELLDGIDKFKTSEGTSCVRLISPDDTQGTFFRARRALDTPTIRKVLNDPPRAMGPPAGHLARAGRMNPTGISVFYGAFQPETCLVEIRIPVGGTAFTASFHLVRTITILDLTALEHAVHGVSWMDPAFDHISDKLAFLSRFHDEISRPVLEHEQDIEFIPTQVVAEYLAHRFKPSLDGIIYASSQTGNDDLNIALFHHASGIQSTQGSVETGDVDPEITVSEYALTVRTPLKVEDATSNPESFSSYDFLPLWDEPDPSKDPDVDIAATIEFEDGSLKYWRVLSTEQHAEPLSILDFRKKDHGDF